MGFNGLYLRPDDTVGSDGAILSMNYQDYTEKMIRDGRFASIAEDGRVVILMLFSVCNEPKVYLDNLDHEYLEHDPEGHILVVEDLISSVRFGIRFVDVIEDIFCQRYPNIDRFMWRRFRKPRDKIYSIGRRHSYAV